jgi:hypothetical protein
MPPKVANEKEMAGKAEKGNRVKPSANGLNFLLRLENLASAILPRFEVDMMRPAKLARVLVFNIGWRAKGVCGAAEAALHPRYFSLGDCHLRKAPDKQSYRTVLGWCSQKLRHNRSLVRPAIHGL